MKVKSCSSVLGELLVQQNISGFICTGYTHKPHMYQLARAHISLIPRQYSVIKEFGGEAVLTSEFFCRLKSGLNQDTTLVEVEFTDLCP